MWSKVTEAEAYPFFRIRYSCWFLLVGREATPLGFGAFSVSDFAVNICTLRILKSYAFVSIVG